MTPRSSSTPRRSWSRTCCCSASPKRSAHECWATGSTGIRQLLPCEPLRKVCWRSPRVTTKPPRRHCNRCSPHPTRAWRNRSSGHCGLPSPRRCSPTATEVMRCSRSGAIEDDFARWPGVRKDRAEGARPPAAGSLGAPTARSPREKLEVAALVAGGLTNGQLADRLFISPKTAAVHVSNILASSVCRPAPRSRRGRCVTTSRRGRRLTVRASFSPGWSRSRLRPRPSAPRGGWSGQRRACRAGSRRTPAGSVAGVHDERPVPGDRLADRRLPTEQQHLHATGARVLTSRGFDGERVTTAEHGQVAGVDQAPLRDRLRRARRARRRGS